MRKILKCFMILELVLCSIFCMRVKVCASEMKQKELYTLEDPTWFRKTGFTKGIGHDKQDLGIILSANAKLTIRQVNPNFKGKLTVRLLNDNNKHETYKTFNETSITISTAFSSVPFVETPYGSSEKPKVEYSVSGYMQDLPIYKKGDNEQAFFTKWDNTSASFALVIDDYFQLLVPQKDKTYMKNMKDFSSIDKLIIYYGKIFEYYNKLAGISFNTNIQTDKNIPNKYFIKADKSGPGGGYYGGNHTAETSDSVASFWLKKGWGALHEIGHGYQNDFTRGEVWNNIYAHSLQKKDSDVNIFTNGWLYDYGRKDTVDYNVNKLWHNDKIDFNKWGLREQLYGYVLMKDKALDYSFTHFNQEYRKLANIPGFNTSDYKQFDLISRTYGEISKLDFTPVIESFGGDMTSWQKEENRYKNYKPVAPLNEVVPANEASKIQKLLNLETPLSLVTTDDLLITGLKGDVTLNLKINDFNQIKNGFLCIMSGDKEVKKVVITNPTIYLGKLPVGIYTIYSTNSSDKLYTLDNHYLKVKETNNNIILNYKLRKKSTLVNQEINFLGISDNLFAKATVDLQNEKLNVKVLNRTPHDYFPNEQYAKIEILDEFNNVTYTKIIYGTNASLEDSIETLKEGYKIRLYHREPSRLKIRDNETAITNNQVNTLIVTSQGLKNQYLNQNLNEELAIRIENFARKIHAEKVMVKSDCAESKIELKLAIDALLEPLRSEMLTKYKDLLPNENIYKENPNEGSIFTFHFKGYSDEKFAEFDLDLTNLESKLTVENIEPHYYFNDTYALIVIQDNYGQTVFTKDFIGNKISNAVIRDIPLKDGYYLTIKHREYSNRLFINNKDKNLQLNKSATNFYKITKNELKEISESDIPKPNKDPYIGKIFNATFKGLGDFIFAELNLDLNSKLAKVDIKKGKPHVYFADSYASMLIRDTEGNVVFTKDLVGDKEYEPLVTSIHIKSGYYITMKHREADGRLLIKNVENELELEKGNSISYKITDNGIKKISDDEIPDKLPNNQWKANVSYNAGDIVSFEEKVYKAKWWSRGFKPNTKVQNSWDTPWELVN
ncbi:putative mucin/carbohydrate-binding domain-containing protein [Clostridium rectalis]|uniref:putative mucin/carbohydrate-binding domain-containing protein n=1 Tax=Clostridium rectalis TaxID=2040295 RepID=UPI000F6342F9|nr:putative mucin/carbohydrate-binding domain-containing protein [Clostridium rectalis]